MEWKVGDRVKVMPSESWQQPIRGWAERGRVATVARVYVKHGATNPEVAVIFDRARFNRLEHFKPEDLIPATPPSA